MAPNKIAKVHRVTMFKIPDKEDQEKLIAQYDVLAKTQEKDGKPYIVYLAAGPAEDDPRSQGYTVAAKTEFASLEDMQYYDTTCQAHKNLKAFALTLGVTTPPLTVYFQPKDVYFF